MYKHAITFRVVCPWPIFRYYKPINYPCPVCMAPVGRRCRDRKGMIIHYHLTRTKHLRRG
jgi:hypothetical protein